MTTEKKTLADLRKRFQVRAPAPVMELPMWTHVQVANAKEQFDVIVTDHFQGKFRVGDLRVKFGGPKLEGELVSTLAAVSPQLARWLYTQMFSEETRAVILYHLREDHATVMAKFEAVDSDT